MNITLQQKKLLGFKTLAPFTYTVPGFKSGKPLTEGTIGARIGAPKVGGAKTRRADWIIR